MRSRNLFRPSLLSFASFAPIVSLLAFGCSSGGSSGSGSGGGGSSPAQQNRVTGQSDFVSAPLPGQVTAASSFNGNEDGGVAVTAPTTGSAGASNSSSSSSAPTRTIQETDLYRVDGNHLYYLNSYRGLMVFDITNVDQPKLVGRHAIFGTPIDMIVDNGIAVVIVSDYYGVNAGGGPFYGSIVRGLDATDPTNIKTVGEAQLGGSVVDSRVVGNVLYTVSQNDQWNYGWYSDPTTGVSQNTTQIAVNSVSFAGGAIKSVAQATFPGYSGVFNVTENSIMLAHDTSTNGNNSATSELQYIDISDPNGKIALRGKMTVPGTVEGWGTDNGRWNLDFADQKYAHVLTQSYDDTGYDSYQLTTVDFTSPSAPVLDSTIAINGQSWSPSARFVTGRMYLSPDSSYWGSSQGTTPVEIFDLTNPKAPSMVGSTNVTGQIYNFTPNGNQLFALGNTYAADGSASDTMSLHYLDVTDPTKPSELGVANFGNGWSWSPAADTFKAFTLDTTDGLVVLPFSGWSWNSNTYNNGLQLIEFTPTTIATKGAAKTKGWVERGIFVNGRLFSLSDQALSVVDYSNHASPRIVTQLTLARNVVDAQPDGTTLAELSSDWYGYDKTSTQMRVLPLANATESTDTSAVPTANIGGSDARVFRNGNLAYVVTDVTVPVDCSTQTNGGYGGGGAVPVGAGGSGGSTGCTTDTTQMQVVDLSSGSAVLRGKITLPVQGTWASDGFYWYDWYNGADAVQVGGDALAFRRWNATYTQDGRWTADQTLYIVDAHNADAPAISSTLITADPNAWWGNMQVVGDTLYTNHYEWNDWYGNDGQNTVRYYLDQIDLSDRAHPSIGKKINVPGLLVGASATDPTILYTIDYRWDGTNPKNELAVLKIDDGRAYLQSNTAIGGWVGDVYVQGTKAYTTVTHYDWDTSTWSGPTSTLHQIDLTNPNAPADQVASTQAGWGWLLGVVGDRAIVSSGWGSGENVDVYKLTNAAPVYDQTIRTLGWDTETIHRQDNTLFIASGYWGTQAVQLNQ